MSTIQVVGVDMAFANMGLVRGVLDLNSLELKLVQLELVTTSAEPGKQVRKSSTELARARALGEALRKFCDGASLMFAEVPSGSQSASAARALGIAVGVLSGSPIPIVEVSPMEVKALFSTSRQVTKGEIINWAVAKWPEAGWKSVKRKGKPQLTKDNEHLADAVATIVAGLKTQQFQLIRAITHETPMPRYDRPASRRQRQRIVSVGPVPVSGRARIRY